MGLAVITGAGSGIGAALCEALAARGRPLVLIGRSPRIEATCERIRARRPSATLWCLRGDLAPADERQALIERIHALADDAGAAIETLVHAAAVGEPNASLEDLSVADVERALVINTVAPLALSQGLLGLLEGGERAGRILLVTSGVAERPQPGTGAYGISKAALERLWRQLQSDLAYDGRDARVTVGLFQPGIVDTVGLREHIARAGACGLPHADYLREAIEAGAARSPASVAEAMAALLLDTPTESFGQWRWHSRDWLGD